KIVQIQGPEFTQSSHHKLILHPKEPKNRDPRSNCSESSSDDGDDSDYDFDSDISLDENLFEDNNLGQESKKKVSTRKYLFDKKMDSLVQSNSLSIRCQQAANTQSFYQTNKESKQFNFSQEFRSNINQGPKLLVDRSSLKRTISNAPQSQINSWFLKSQIKLGPLKQDQYEKITLLLYTYQDLNSTELAELPPTDIYIHRLRRIINDGLKCVMYERTMEANGELSDWNAQANLVDKSDNPREWDEPQLTFNHQNVVEDIPGCFVELSSTTHDYMGHPSPRLFHKLDLKHGYWAISVHPDDRKYFAFSIAGIGQLQPTRMPQGSITSMFSFTELIYISLGAIPPTKTFEGWDPLLASSTPHSLPQVAFYVDDIFSGFENFDQGYDILENRLLPRLVWAKLKLSLKKLELFVTSTVVLGVLHKAVKNFAEIRKPLSRLTGNVEFEWDSKEQVSFQILKEKCAEAVEMHGWNYLDPVRMYTDASIYGGGCVITQERIDRKGNLMEVPLIYDAFTFSKSQQGYGIYKKELCSIVEFARKYDHMFRVSKTSLIFTDHKPLTWFLKSYRLDGIYSRWAAELRSLYIDIVWIQGKRNVAADALSRTIFPSSEFNTPPLEQFGEMRKCGIVRTLNLI
ncbi:hypothetical protein EPUL_005332, partial [Erysiphe pulchra]